MSTTDSNIPAPAKAPAGAGGQAATDSAPAAPTATAPAPANAPPAISTPPKISLDTSSRNSEPALDFAGDVNTNNALPTQTTLSSIEDYPVLDREGKSVPFKSLYTGPNVPRRVLLIFVRHFYCGNCQQYLRALSASITPDALLQLPVPTFIAVIGCGAPSLIQMDGSYSRSGRAPRIPAPRHGDEHPREYRAGTEADTGGSGAGGRGYAAGWWGVFVRAGGGAGGKSGDAGGWGGGGEEGGVVSSDEEYERPCGGAGVEGGVGAGWVGGAGWEREEVDKGC
ncbi:hypothetical protein V493_06048 [Pseudogymnoascus sp. VKM F-4281 (FW-2241)]|nr:hypothetical protein V493_06048 [Pseudogymnoascus sp. VKM F-4281 (FW-2241)]